MEHLQLPLQKTLMTIGARCCEGRIKGEGGIINRAKKERNIRKNSAAQGFIPAGGWNPLSSKSKTAVSWEWMREE